MSWFQAVRIYSAAEIMVFAALLVVAIGELGETPKAILGWTHGIGWIVLCVLVYIGCMRRVFPWPLLAATVSPLGPVGSTAGLEWLAHRRRRHAREPRGGRPAGGRARVGWPDMVPLNVPNAITIARVLLVPVVVYALLDAAPERSIVAAVVFAIAAATDGVDGWIARTTSSETTFGKVMDPVADKLLVAAALVVLVAADRLAAWIAIVIILREFAVSGLRIYAGQAGLVVSASMLGKWKTVLQIAAVIALIAAQDPAAGWVLALVYAAVVLTVVSGVDYFLGVRGRVAEARERAAGRIGAAPESPPA